MNENLLQVKSEITKVLRGKEDCIDQILCCMLAGGHILLEDIPGVGKTTLAVALSRAMSLHYKRMQFIDNTRYPYQYFQKILDKFLF